MQKYAILAAITAVVISSMVVVTEPHAYNALMTFVGASTQYTPSDMSKNNPNIEVGVGTATSWPTTSISDVKERVSHTIMGKVVQIDEPLPWMDSAGNEKGAIPVEIQVEKAYKGVAKKGEIFTVYVDSIKIENKYYTAPFEASYEVGEDVIVHVRKADPSASDPIDKLPYTALGKLGKYKIQNDRAYNEKFPYSVPIDFAANEAK